MRWFEVVCLVFSALLPRPTECGTWPTNILARLETPTSSSSPAASLVLPDECGKNLFHLTSSASGDVLADYSHRGHRRCVHQLLTRPRSTRQQVAYIHFQWCVVPTFLSISSSNASWSLCRRAIAGVVGRPQCTINDSLSFSRRPARPAHGRRRPATHRKIYNFYDFYPWGRQLFGVGVPKLPERPISCQSVTETCPVGLTKADSPSGSY